MVYYSKLESLGVECPKLSGGRTILRNTTRRIVLTAAPLIVILAGALLVLPRLTTSSAEPGDPSAKARPAASVATDVRKSPVAAPQYRMTADDTLQVSLDGGGSYADTTPVALVATSTEAAATGISARETSPSSSHVLSYGWDSAVPSRVAVTTADTLYLSEDHGSSWSEIPIKNQINSNVKLTSVDLSPYDRNTMVVGTSFNGIFETTNLGKSWKEISDTKALRFFYRGAGFWEEVTSVDYDPTNPSILSFTLGYGYGTFRWDRSTGAVTKVDTSAGDSVASMTSVAAPLLDTANAQAQQRMKVASNRVGIYVSPYNAQGDRLPGYLDFAKKEGLNSIVVDFKDDFGYLRYDSHVPTARSAGAVRPLFGAKNLIAQAHAKGIYVIARMVVFKDRELYSYDDGKYALFDSTTNRPWGVFRKEEVPVVQKSENGQTGSAATAVNADAPKKTELKTVQVEWWVDPYSQFVWDYNIAIAKELQTLGVDEIQFDYIRFPSDGYVSRIVSHYKKPGMDRVGALSGFLKKARQSLTVPISIDVYGFNSWYRTVYLGQDIEELSRYVDVICPMFYPSHFSREFYQNMSYIDRAQFIYHEGTRRAEDIVHGSAVIRPWVQSFLIGGELKFDEPTYWTYLTNQLTGAAEGKAAGYTLWNASGHYYMVAKPITGFTEPYSSSAVPPGNSTTP